MTGRHHGGTRPFHPHGTMLMAVSTIIGVGCRLRNRQGRRTQEHGGAVQQNAKVLLHGALSLCLRTGSGSPARAGRRCRAVPLFSSSLANALLYGERGTCCLRSPPSEACTPSSMLGGTAAGAYSFTKRRRSALAITEKE